MASANSPAPKHQGFGVARLDVVFRSDRLGEFELRRTYLCTDFDINIAALSDLEEIGMTFCSSAVSDAVVYTETGQVVVVPKGYLSLIHI